MSCVGGYVRNSHAMLWHSAENFYLIFVLEATWNAII